VTLAAQLDAINRETVGFLRAQATRAFNLANTDGNQQAVMDALGTQAASALQAYAAIHGVLTALGAADGIPNPDFSIWSINPDGTVQYKSRHRSRNLHPPKSRAPPRSPSP
jgi:hypothetical protein